MFPIDENQEMCDKVILENGDMLKFVSHCYKNKKMYNNAVDNYAHTVELIPDKTKPWILTLLSNNLLLIYIIQ